eukprot:GHVS01039729.1.p1 GENE.GHVS01039729.1~~GHVS01039729.1.p1  ORF type:complete len:280 (+),score=31.63 GHVS01039729.1:658-1497(+)
MEIIQEIGRSSSWGLSYIIRERLPHHFVKELDEDSLLDADARIGVMDLLVSVIQAAPTLATELITACQEVLPTCLEQFLLCPKSSTDSAAMHLCGINSWGRICSCPEGLQALLKYGHLRSHMEEVVRSFDASTSCAAIRAWTGIAVGIPRDKLLQEIASALEGSVVPRVLEIMVRRPFAESREACYNLMTAMMEYESAARALVQNQTCLRILLDGRSEEHSTSMCAKHAMVKSLLSHHMRWIPDVVDTAAVTSLEEYGAGGPFYIPKETTADVAKEAAQ